MHRDDQADVICPVASCLCRCHYCRAHRSLGSPAAAQDKYPSRPVELIVPFAAGGGTDILARLLTDGLTRRLGQTFLVINRPGANTNLGTGQVARAKPDGYTLLMTSFGLAANPSLYRNLGFDPAKDLTPVSLLANAPTILVVHPSFPPNTLAGIHRASESQSGQVQLRLLRRRLEPAYRRRALQAR